MRRASHEFAFNMQLLDQVERLIVFCMFKANKGLFICII